MESVVSHMGRTTNCGLDAMGYAMAGTTISVLVLQSKAYQRTFTVTAVQANCTLLHLTVLYFI